MNTPRCFSQFSAGSRSLGAHLAILGRAYCAGRMGGSEPIYPITQSSDGALPSLSSPELWPPYRLSCREQAHRV